MKWLKINSKMVVNTGDGVEKYKFTRKAGKNIVERRPVFAPDGESLLLVVEDVVRVYNIQTGDCVRTLETEKQVESIVSVEFLDKDSYNLFGCSNSGRVTIWTWENGAVLREIDLKLPADYKVLSFNLIDGNDCFVVASTKKNAFLHLASYSMKTGDIQITYSSSKILVRNILTVSLGCCDNDRYAAISNGTKCLFIQNLVQPHLKAEINNHNKLRIISSSAHPTESAVAVTDALGRVTIFRGYLYDYRNLAKEVMHWHHLPVFASCFSREGTYLYTGGMERVLLKWTLGNIAHRAQEKQFIPRLPAMVKYVAANSTHIAITLTNNSVVIASTQMRVLNTIMECGGLSETVRTLGSSLVYHRPTGALLLPAKTGHLHLYSTNTDHLLCNIDITQVNDIPPTRENLMPLDLEVVCAAVSANGSWLVTSEYRNDNIFYPEERLKFWAAQQKNTVPFKLNTCVNLSHGGSRVVSIALNNEGEFCVSAGLDQKFRIWKRETNEYENKKTFSWKCLTACYYSSGFTQSLAHEILNDFKNSNFNKGDKVDAMEYMTKDKRVDAIRKVLNANKYSRGENKKCDSCNDDTLVMGSVAISQDGSLIAAWFGAKLTLWDTHQCNLRTSLSHPVLRPKGLHTQFGNHDAAHYLVCTTEKCLAVWSLLSLTIKWYVNMRPTCLTADPFTNKMAVLTQVNDVFVFTPHSPTPILKCERLIEPRTGVFKQCAFAAAVKEDVRLYMMRNDSEIYSLEPESSQESNLEVISRRHLPASNFSALLAEQQHSEVKSLQPTALQHTDSEGLGRGATAQFLSAAPHMMPPVSLLCTPFLEHISGRQPPETNETSDVTVMEVDDASSDEDEPIENRTQSGAKKVELWTPNYEQVKEKRLRKILKESSIDSNVTVSLFGT